jgi:transposase-like protein DUF772
MAELGLLRFARIALQVSCAVLPRYRSRFSKHQFTQPQLLAIPCLMRYEDWTFREAEVRLGEHRELRQTLGFSSAPDFTTLYRFLQRLDDQTIDRAVDETVRRLRGTQKKRRRRARVGVDATGLAQGAVSTFFVRRMHHHEQKPLPWRHWLKWMVVADLDQQFLLSQKGRRGPWNDCANLPAVVRHILSSGYVACAKKIYGSGEVASSRYRGGAHCQTHRWAVCHRCRSAHGESGPRRAPRSAQQESSRATRGDQGRSYRSTCYVIACQRPGQSRELHTGALAETHVLPGIPGTRAQQQPCRKLHAPCGARKNWIHIGSQQAGPKVAAILSVVETCRRMNIPVREYLAAVLPGLADMPMHRLAQLTPAAWATHGL